MKIKPLYALIVALIAASPLGLVAAGTAWGEWGVDEIRNGVNGGEALGFVRRAWRRDSISRRRCATMP